MDTSQGAAAPGEYLVSKGRRWVYERPVSEKPKFFYFGSSLARRSKNNNDS